MAIQSEFGNAGKSITDQNIDLLIYYLQEEVPSEISFNKLYKAFTALDKDPPLKQYGIEQIKQYEEKLKR